MQRVDHMKAAAERNNEFNSLFKSLPERELFSLEKCGPPPQRITQRLEFISYTYS
jgi:hypothetical protein